jgi:hypothetical protein
MADVIFTVTVPFGTGGGYYIDGVQKPIIPVVTGGTFRFNQNDASNATHPLALSTTTSTAGRITTGVVYYLDGITTQANYYNVTLFNAATVRYIEITVTQTSDFYYICNVHGASMGNVMDITVNTWGALSWNAGAWNQQNNINENLTNLLITTSLNNVDAFNNEGWGRLSWGSLVWGEDAENATVSVTTPGTPTTWGQSTYGNYSWNQITGAQIETGEELIEAGASIILSTNLLNVVNGTVSAQANFIIEVTGIELNTTVANVFGGENVVVQVTTPGAQTTWGQGNFGQYAWNQITGSEIDIGNETVEGTGSFSLTGVQINTTTASLAGTAVPTTWGFETWGSNSWQQTNNFIVGDANVNLTTNILSITQGNAGPVSSTDVFVTSPGNLPWGATSWGNGSWGNIGGMFISQGAEEEATPGVEVFVSTNLLTLTLTSIAQITADANITANTNLLTTSLGNEDAVPNTVVTLSTNLLNVSVGAASGEVLSTVSVTGVNMTTSTGRVFIAAWAVVDIGVTNTWSVVDIAA